jgi:hypothetical protein
MIVPFPSLSESNERLPANGRPRRPDRSGYVLRPRPGANPFRGTFPRLQRKDLENVMKCATVCGVLLALLPAYGIPVSQETRPNILVIRAHGTCSGSSPLRTESSPDECRFPGLGPAFDTGLAGRVGPEVTAPPGTW